MIASEVFRAKDGVFRLQGGYPTTKRSNSAKTAKTTQNITFCSDGRPGSCYIDSQPLYFHKWSYIRFLVLKMGIPDHKVAPLPKKRPKLTKIVKSHEKSLRSALTRDPTAVKLAVNQSIFIKWYVLSKILTARSRCGFWIITRLPGNKMA